MISRVRGTVLSKTGMEVVVDCGGLGYTVMVPLSTMDVVPAVGESVTLFTVFTVREDAFSLFGFASEPEREAFKLLTTIQGIGGRTALGILSSAVISDLQAAIMQGNIPALMRLPGIGKKTAERMVVELRDKMVTVAAQPHEIPAVGHTQQVADAISALQALGFTRQAAEKAVKQAITAHPELSDSSEQLIRTALRGI